MQTKTKRRAIGVISLIMLMIILTLIISHRAKKHQGMITEPVSLPRVGLTQPSTNKTVAAPPVLNANPSSPVSVKPTVTLNSSSGDLKAVALVKKNNNASFQWVMQVATFHQKLNAKNLLSQLKKARYDVFMTNDMESKSHPVYRVFIGPEVNKQSFVMYKKELWRKFKLHGGIVRSYQS